MAKFRKKPVVVEAWPVIELIRLATHNWYGLPESVRDAYENAGKSGRGVGGWVFCPGCIYVPTLEGNMKAERDDWIICGTEGEFYPCKPAAFAATFVEAETPIDDQAETIERLIADGALEQPKLDHRYRLWLLSHGEPVWSTADKLDDEGAVPLYVLTRPS